MKMTEKSIDNKLEKIDAQRSQVFSGTIETVLGGTLMTIGTAMHLVDVEIASNFLNSAYTIVEYASFFGGACLMGDGVKRLISAGNRLYHYARGNDNIVNYE